MALKPVRAPLINGVGFSWASVNMTISCESTGKSIDLEKGGFSSVNFTSTRDRGIAYGPHPDPLFKTRGQNKYDSFIRFYLSTLKYIIAEVLGGAGYGDRFFTVEIQYAENGLDAKTVEIRACTLDSRKIDNAKGTDATEVECDLHPLKILEDGLDDVDNPLAA